LSPLGLAKIATPAIAVDAGSKRRALDEPRDVPIGQPVRSSVIFGFVPSDHLELKYLSS
jgi:hypothetical protein